MTTDWTVHILDERGKELVKMNAYCLWPAERHLHAYEIRGAIGVVSVTGDGHRLFVRFRGNDIWSEVLQGPGHRCMVKGKLCAVGTGPEPWYLNYKSLITSHSAFTDGDDTDVVITERKQRYQVLAKVVHHDPRLPARFTVKTGQFEARITWHPTELAHGTLSFNGELQTKAKLPHSEGDDGETLVSEGATTLDAIIERLNALHRWWAERCQAPLLPPAILELAVPASNRDVSKLLN